MIAHPAVVHRLNWMGASGYRTGGGTVFCAVQGTSGHALHDGNEPMSPSRGYQFKNGQELLRDGDGYVAVAGCGAGFGWVCLCAGFS